MFRPGVTYTVIVNSFLFLYQLCLVIASQYFIVPYHVELMNIGHLNQSLYISVYVRYLFYQGELPKRNLAKMSAWIAETYSLKTNKLSLQFFPKILENSPTSQKKKNK